MYILEPYVSKRLSTAQFKQVVRCALRAAEMVVPIWRKDKRVPKTFKPFAHEGVQAIKNWLASSSTVTVKHWHGILASTDFAIDIITPIKEILLAILSRADFQINNKLPGTWNPIEWAINDALYIVHMYNRQKLKTVYNIWKNKCGKFLDEPVEIE